MLGTIKAKYYADFEIDPIPISDQCKIAKLHALAQKEIRLLTELAEEKRKYYARAITLIQGDLIRSHHHDN